MPSPSMNTSSEVMGGYCRSGPQRYSVPFRSFGTEPLRTSRSWASDSTRRGAPQPRYNGMSGNLTSMETSFSIGKNRRDDFFDTAPQFGGKKAWFLPPATARRYTRASCSPTKGMLSHNGTGGKRSRPAYPQRGKIG